MRNMPLCDEIAAPLQRFQLRTSLQFVKNENRFELFLRQVERARGYLDCLEDAGLISCLDHSAANAELSHLLQEWLA